MDYQYAGMDQLGSCSIHSEPALLPPNSLFARLPVPFTRLHILAAPHRLAFLLHRHFRPNLTS